MVTMQAPRAFYGYLDRSLVLCLKGQIRYVMARALRSYLDELTARSDHDTIIFDLREIEAIDSTAMGMLARVGKKTLKHGRRSLIVCPLPDVATCLRSAAFDTLFIMEETWPFENEPQLSEVPLERSDLPPEVLGRLMLEAHRELAAMSDANQREFASVIHAMGSEVERGGRG